MGEPGFWDEPEAAAKTSAEHARAARKLETLNGLQSDVADLVNSPANPFAGASVAGLFLDRFVPEGVDWAHFDTFAWRPTAKPGRPKGGDALGLRAAWHFLREQFG